MVRRTADSPEPEKTPRAEGHAEPTKISPLGASAGDAVPEPYSDQQKVPRLPCARDYDELIDYRMSNCDLWDQDYVVAFDEAILLILDGKIRPLKGKNALIRWACVLARRVELRIAATAKSRKEVKEVDADYADVPPSTEVEDQESQELIDDSVAELRLVGIAARRQQGQSVDQIAYELMRSPTGVNGALYRAREKLQPIISHLRDCDHKDRRKCEKCRSFNRLLWQLCVKCIPSD